MVEDDRSVRFRPDTEPTASLSVELRLRGKPLDDWIDEEELSFEDLTVGSAQWRARIEDQRSSFETETRIAPDGSPADIELAPSTYDIAVEPFALGTRQEGHREPVHIPLTGDGGPGAVDGGRTIAEDLEVRGEESLSANLEPVRVDVRDSTQNLDGLRAEDEQWALRFVDTETGRLFSQPVELGGQTDSTWSYPGTYRVWLQPYRDFAEGGQLGDADFGTPRRASAVLANGRFRSESGATLELKAEAVQWDARARFDGPFVGADRIRRPGDGLRRKLAGLGSISVGRTQRPVDPIGARGVLACRVRSGGRAARREREEVPGLVTAGAGGRRLRASEKRTGHRREVSAGRGVVVPRCLSRSSVGWIPDAVRNRGGMEAAGGRTDGRASESDAGGTAGAPRMVHGGALDVSSSEATEGRGLRPMSLNVVSLPVFRSSVLRPSVFGESTQVAG